MKNTHGLFQRALVAGCGMTAVAFALVARGVSAGAQPFAYLRNLLSTGARLLHPSNDPVWSVP